MSLFKKTPEIKLDIKAVEFNAPPSKFIFDKQEGKWRLINGKN